VLTNSAFVAVNAALPNIGIVSGVAGNVTTVAGIAGNVSAVANASGNVGAVAGSIASVNTAAANIAAIQGASANAATASTQAGIAVTQATAAAASAATANTSAGASAGSAAQALAIFGSTAIQQAAVTAAANSASVAAGHAASAASVAQQDLSGVNAAALHRSPNAVTALFIYDTAKDSDGGAWRKRMAHTSWMNEPLAGKWLGAQASEAAARNANAIYSAELIPDPNFASAAAWQTNDATITIANNTVNYTATPTAKSVFVSQSRSGAFVRTVVVVNSITAGALQINVNGTSNTVTVAGTYTFEGVASAASTVGIASVGVTTAQVSFFSVKSVTAQTTAAGDYFQRTTDGRFWSLNVTSGITETFRGNKAEFPALSAIVAEASSVTIYDLTAPGNPMWMRFGNPSEGYSPNRVPAIGGGAAIASLAAINGLVAAGGSSSAQSQAVILFSFPTDRAGNISSNSVWGGWTTANLAQRHVPSTFQAGSLPLIVNSIVNAVAMTVLPDAPIDLVSGLAIPTIFAGTAGGISVIQNTGIVRNSLSTLAVTKIAATPDALFWATSAGVLWAANPGSLGAGFAAGTYNTTTAPAQLALPTSVTPGRTKAFGSALGITLLRDNPSLQLSGLAAAIGSTFNSGYMTGDIRRCWLSDTGAGVVTGPELVVNGGFDTDTNWTKHASVSILGGVATLDGSALPNSITLLTPSVALTLTAGKIYQVSYSITGGAGGNLSVGFSNVHPEAVTSIGNYVNYLVAASGSTLQLLTRGGNYPRSWSIDNISVREVIADRTHRNRPLSIIGSLTKAPVAPGAQLMGFSGFSAVNYGQEAYDAGLDFGTGAWTASAWVNTPTLLPPANFPIVGPELVSNGDFASNISGWTLSGDGALSNPAGRLRIDTAAPNINEPSANQTLGMITGRSYLLTFNLVAASNGGAVSVAGTRYPITAGAGVKSYLLKFAFAPSLSFSSNTPSAGHFIEVDNVSVREIGLSCIEDRSAATGPYRRIGLDGNGNIAAEVFDGTTTRRITSPAAYNNGTWVKARVDYTVNGTLTLRVNGVVVATTTGAPLLSMNNVNAVTTVGNNRELNAPFPGSLALVKVGATIPTQEQGVWMYEQEKQMFRDGAQVCLPDSGAVVDLAYDDLTDRWTAISGSNESAFSGLVRTRTAPSPAGTFNRIAKQSGVRLASRITTTPGVDITMPAAGLREELVRRNEAAAAASKPLTVFNFDSIAAQVDFAVPAGYTAIEVLSAGSARREGPTRDWVRVFDGFIETVRFAVAPGAAVWVQINARKA
jgi:hypothetical protein